MNDKEKAEAKEAADKEKAAADKKVLDEKTERERKQTIAKTAPRPEKAPAGTKIPAGMSEYSTRLKEEMPEQVKKALSKIKGKVLDWKVKDQGTVVITQEGGRYLVKNDGSVEAPKQPPKKKAAKKEAA